MTTIERRGVARGPSSLLALLACLVLGSATATASDWPTRDQIRTLHAEVDQLSTQLEKLESAAVSEEHGDALDEHWRAMQQHLVSVRENG
jgi:hypothetical protein